MKHSVRLKPASRPGTRWEDVPDDWICPDCGTGKQDFEMQVVAA